MKSELTTGWNVFKQIFHDHWDEFKQFHPRYDYAYYDELVNKMLACGNPDQIGYLDGCGSFESMQKVMNFNRL